MNTWAITRQDILITGSIAAVAIGLAGMAGCSSTDSAPTAAPTTVTSVSTGSPVAAAPTPQLADFQVNVIITNKQCFGPANCVYHYTIDPWPTASFPLQPTGRKLTIIYTVTGGNQDQIGNYVIDYASDLPEGETRLFRDTDAVVIGPDNANLVATVTRVIVEDS